MKIWFSGFVKNEKSGIMESAFGSFMQKEDYNKTLVHPHLGFRRLQSVSELREIMAEYRSLHRDRASFRPRKHWKFHFVKNKEIPSLYFDICRGETEKSWEELESFVLKKSKYFTPFTNNCQDFVVEMVEFMGFRPFLSDRAKSNIAISLILCSINVSIYAFYIPHLFISVF